MGLNEKHQLIQVKYFIIQVITSSLLIIGCFLTFKGAWLGDTIITFSLIIKIGVAPAHLWFINILIKSNKLSFILLSTVSKIIPIYFVFNILTENHLMYLIILNTIISRILIISIQRFIEIISYSRVFNSSWILASNYNINNFIIFIATYIITIITLLRFLVMPINKTSNNIGLTSNFIIDKLTFILRVFSLAGIPPIVGFIGKTYILISLLFLNNIPLSLLLVRASTLLIWTYLSRIRNIILNTPLLYALSYKIEKNVLLMSIILILPIIAILL